MSNPFKIIILDAGPITILAAAGLLDLLLAPPNAEIVVIKNVLNEIINHLPEFQQFNEKTDPESK